MFSQFRKTSLKISGGKNWSIVNSVAKYEAAQKSLSVQAVYNSIYKI